jgi:hypothetical protein
MSFRSGWQDLNLQQPAPKALPGAASGGNHRAKPIVSPQNDSDAYPMIPVTSAVNRNGSVAIAPTGYLSPAEWEWLH